MGLSPCSLPWAEGLLHKTQRVKGLLDLMEVMGFSCKWGLHIHWNFSSCLLAWSLKLWLAQGKHPSSWLFQPHTFHCKCHCWAGRTTGLLSMLSLSITSFSIREIYLCLSVSPSSSQFSFWKRDRLAGPSQTCVPRAQKRFYSERGTGPCLSLPAAKNQKPRVTQCCVHLGKAPSGFPLCSLPYIPVPPPLTQGVSTHVTSLHSRPWLTALLGNDCLEICSLSCSNQAPCSVPQGIATTLCYRLNFFFPMSSSYPKCLTPKSGCSWLPGHAKGIPLFREQNA